MNRCSGYIRLRMARIATSGTVTGNSAIIVAMPNQKATLSNFDAQARGGKKGGK